LLYLSIEFKQQQSMLTPDKIIEFFVKVVSILTISSTFILAISALITSIVFHAL